MKRISSVIDLTNEEQSKKKHRENPDTIRMWDYFFSFEETEQLVQGFFTFQRKYNLCICCYIYMGSSNPRQFCKKTYCPHDEVEDGVLLVNLRFQNCLSNLIGIEEQEDTSHAIQTSNETISFLLQAWKKSLTKKENKDMAIGLVKSQKKNYTNNNNNNRKT
jgi:hypothetical protein